jgi:hypothetical protein
LPVNRTGWRGCIHHDCTKLCSFVFVALVHASSYSCLQFRQFTCLLQEDLEDWSSLLKQRLQALPCMYILFTKCNRTHLLPLSVQATACEGVEQGTLPASGCSAALAQACCLLTMTSTAPSQCQLQPHLIH